MARSSARAGRTVAVFFIGLAVAYGLVALVGTWKPALGLDLEGGTQIQLTAKGNVSKDNLNEAADIIDARVNGSGVSEAEVTTQGSNMIVVQIPGSTESSLVQTVTRQAELRFRLVAQVAPTGTPQTPLPSPGASPGSSPGSSPAPGSGVTLPPSSAPTKSTSDKPKNNGGNNRTPALLGKNKQDPKDKNKNGTKGGKNQPSPSPTANPTGNVPDSTSQVNYT